MRRSSERKKSDDATQKEKSAGKGREGEREGETEKDELRRCRECATPKGRGCKGWLERRLVVEVGEVRDCGVREREGERVV